MHQFAGYSSISQSHTYRHSSPGQNQCSPDTAPTNHPNIRKEDNVTNIHVHKLTNTQPVMKRVTKSQLLFLGNSIRKSKDDLIQHYCLIFRRMENELEHDKGQHICYTAPK